MKSLASILESCVWETDWSPSKFHAIVEDIKGCLSSHRLKFIHSNYDFCSWEQISFFLVSLDSLPLMLSLEVLHSLATTIISSSYTGFLCISAFLLAPCSPMLKEQHILLFTDHNLLPFLFWLISLITSRFAYLTGETKHWSMEDLVFGPISK